MSERSERTMSILFWRHADVVLDRGAFAGWPLIGASR
jgi:hypothetical protein